MCNYKRIEINVINVQVKVKSIWNNITHLKKIILLILIIVPNFLFAQLVNDFRVNDDTTIAQQYNGRVGVDANGNFAVVWMNSVTINGSVYCQLYNYNAQKIGNNFLIKSNANNPDIAVRKDGSFGVCWNDTVPKFRLFDKLGIPISNIAAI